MSRQPYRAVEGLRTSFKSTFEGLVLRRKLLWWREWCIWSVCWLHFDFGISALVILIFILTLIIIIYLKFFCREVSKLNDAVRRFILGDGVGFSILALFSSTASDSNAFRFLVAVAIATEVVGC